MKEFDYSKLRERTWDNEILAYVAQIHEYKGKQELYLRQRPVELNRMIEIAKIQSTESSNRIEGIVTTNAESTLGKFSKQDALIACPSLGSSSVESALKRLVEEGAIIRTGAGRKTMYIRKADNIEA